MENTWSQLTPDEKRAKRFERWLSPPDVEFINTEAEEAYKKRVTRIIKATSVHVMETAAW